MFQVILCLSFMVSVFCNEDFIVNTRECKIPEFTAFSEETNSIYKKLPYIKCTDLDLLTYTTVKNNRGYLHINISNLNQYYGFEEEIDCCLHYVFRSGSVDEPDVGIRKTPCKFFNTSIPLDYDTVMVKCYIGADKIYSNVHRTMIVTESVKQKLKSSKLEPATSKPISVLLIVFDSISRLNFIRTMPETRNFLLKNDFVEFLGYNKIGDNTFPNFNALLTGLNLTQSNSICMPEEIGKLDTCPMIWYDFRDSGYVTAYAEDWASLSTYNYQKKGFKNPPTDYYFKPYVEAFETLGVTVLDTMPYCAGPESEGERVLNLAKDFSTALKNHPTFGLFWMNTFSHNYINSPTRMDEKVKNSFEYLKENGVFNDSIVILLSDHGIRFGDIRRTVQGWYEERMPTNLISVPRWFQEKFPQKYENLKNNSQKLTSTYDVYMTLQEVLALSTQNYTVSSSKACPMCMSLFSAIPEDRSCREAGVSEEWCTCLGKFDKNYADMTDGLKEEAANIALKVIEDTELFESYVARILFSGVSVDANRKTYLLMVFKTNNLATYQVLYRVHGKPLQLGKMVKLLRLY